MIQGGASGERPPFDVVQSGNWWMLPNPVVGGNWWEYPGVGRGMFSLSMNVETF